MDFWISFPFTTSALPTFLFLRMLFWIGCFCMWLKSLRFPLRLELPAYQRLLTYVVSTWTYGSLYDFVCKKCSCDPNASQLQILTLLILAFLHTTILRHYWQKLKENTVYLFPKHWNPESPICRVIILIVEIAYRRYCLLECEMANTMKACKCLRTAHLQPPGTTQCRAAKLRCATHAMGKIVLSQRSTWDWIIDKPLKDTASWTFWLWSNSLCFEEICNSWFKIKLTGSIWVQN